MARMPEHVIGSSNRRPSQPLGRCGSKQAERVAPHLPGDLDQVLCHVDSRGALSPANAAH